ncbi:hypothetical protein [Legionella tunisiensis]|uniref:hypothetical protein n=1 Tax=Legionella tunisiensis TaxID=1034944 RepID=UPI0002E12A7F|nr:hypothetical protein [Legionella tunisiensis]
MYNALVIIVFLISVWRLFHKTIRYSNVWHATVTPLASIIGSGFLISAPLLIYSTGVLAPLVMFIIVMLAYALGSSLRFNIAYLEPKLADNSLPRFMSLIETLSHPILSIAYVISVAFYLKLLAAFIFRGAGIHHLFIEKSLTTVILIFIGVVGRFRGLSMLEWLEIYSVNTKLAIINAILISFAVFNVAQLQEGQWLIKSFSHDSLWLSIREVLGMLIIIQGFETSRYLGKDYNADFRIRTMKYAQWISGAIYLIFVGLALSIFNNIHSISETSIIDLCKVIAPVLPFLLIVAAIMSQFSAAIADTVGGGGLLSEAFHNHLNTKQCYLLLSCVAIALTWLTNIYEIITIASKAFAIYYALQIIITILLKKQLGHSAISILFYVGLTFVMVLVIVFGLPVE